MESQNLVSYNDVDVSALLSMFGFTPVRSSPDNMQRTLFFFKDSKELRELVSSYQAGEPITIRLKPYNKKRKDYLFFVKNPGLLEGLKLEKEN